MAFERTNTLRSSSGRGVVVVDAEPASLTIALSASGFRPRTFSHGEDALRAALRSPPAAIVADWSTCGLQVATMTEEIRRAGLRTPVLVVADRSAGVIEAAFASGAIDFSTKPVGAELVARLQHAVEVAAFPTNVTVGRLAIDLHRRTGSVREPAGSCYDLTLTRVETDLLMALAARLGEEVSVQDLLDSVWGAKTVQPHALEAAMSRLRKKLGASRALIVRTKGAYRLGPKNAPRR
jgi:DNA-binding response OmpR family regulator